MLYRLTIDSFAYELRRVWTWHPVLLPQSDCDNWMSSSLPHIYVSSFTHGILKDTSKMLRVFVLVGLLWFSRAHTGRCRGGGVRRGCNTLIVSVTVPIEICPSLSRLSQRGKGSCGWRPWMGKSLWVDFSSAHGFVFHLWQKVSHKLTPSIFKLLY